VTFFCLRRQLPYLCFFCWHPRCVFGLPVLPLCGAALTFFAAAKKVSKESGLTPPVPVFTHGPSTSPWLARQRASPCSLPTFYANASPASCARILTNTTEPPPPICGKLCVGCRTTEVGAPNFLARTLCFAARKPTHRLPQMGGGKAMTLATEEMIDAGETFKKSACNAVGSARCRLNHGDVGSPWVTVKDWRCERLSFAYFSLPQQRKVGAAPHRGDA